MIYDLLYFLWGLFYVKKSEVWLVYCDWFVVRLIVIDDYFLCGGKLVFCRVVVICFVDSDVLMLIRCVVGLVFIVVLVLRVRIVFFIVLV